MYNGGTLTVDLQLRIWLYDASSISNFIPTHATICIPEKGESLIAIIAHLAWLSLLRTFSVSVGLVPPKRRDVRKNKLIGITRVNNAFDLDSGFAPVFFSVDASFGRCSPFNAY